MRVYMYNCYILYVYEREREWKGVYIYAGGEGVAEISEWRNDDCNHQLAGLILIGV